MDKQNKVYPYIEILFNNKKEWSTDTILHDKTLMNLKNTILIKSQT